MRRLWRRLLARLGGDKDGAGYCLDCGACGYDECCRGSMCKHLVCNYYQFDYDQMRQEVNRAERAPAGAAWSIVDWAVCTFKSLEEGETPDRWDVESLRKAVKNYEALESEQSGNTKGGMVAED